MLTISFNSQIINYYLFTHFVKTFTWYSELDSFGSVTKFTTRVSLKGNISQRNKSALIVQHIVTPYYHSVAPPGLHRECTVANRSITVITFVPIRIWSVALPGIYERTRIPSRFVPVRPGPPTINCRDAPGLTPGLCERGLAYPLKPFFVEGHPMIIFVRN